jgi:aminoglycoside phosphotransferase (APT) family kinase protein
MLALWDIDDASVPSLSHGDAHPGNTYFDVAGHPHFLDWQCVGLAPGLWDATYFMVGALSISDRRKHERELVEHYLTTLRAAGGEISFDDAWLSYRQHQLHGLLWFITPEEMQPIENSVALVKRFAAGVDDHDSFAAVGVSTTSRVDI